MIVYYDNGNKPLLRDCFIESGLRHATPYGSHVLQLIDERTHRHVLPRSVAFQDPCCPEDDDKIIVFDTKIPASYLDWLCKRYPGKRVILWYWNPVANPHRFDQLRNRIELWSYSQLDCARLGMRYNTQLYFDSVAQLAAAEPTKPWPEHPRALFWGREKGREGIVGSLVEELARLGSATEVHMVRNRFTDREHREAPTPYRETIPSLRAADILVDLYASPQVGPSLRVMEALFWNKKLITNNPRAKTLDFYDPRNIFVLGEETRSLEAFLSLPPVPVDPALRDHYLLSNWLRRFDEGGAL